jgi:3-methyladenine DNA glycosylase AlkD
MRKPTVKIDSDTMKTGSTILFRILNDIENKRIKHNMRRDVARVMKSFLYVELEEALEIAAKYVNIEVIEPKRISEREMWLLKQQAEMEIMKGTEEEEEKLRTLSDRVADLYGN